MEVINGDITKLDVDIIVNAANNTLLGGGGVDGAIHRASGPKLLEECKTLHGCETGESKMTNAYNLPCDKIIHTVGPIYHYENDAASLLKSCYKTSYLLAEQYRKENKLDSITIAYPCISTGVYGYPKDEACKIAINTLKELDNNHINVIFVCFDEESYALYKEELGK